MPCVVRQNVEPLLAGIPGQWIHQTFSGCLIATQLCLTEASITARDGPRPANRLGYRKEAEPEKGT